MDLEYESLKQKLNKYKSIKQGMMQNLLTGKIRLVSEAENDNVYELNDGKKKHNWEINEAVIISILVKMFGSEAYPLGRKRYQKLSYLFHKFIEHKVTGYRKKAAGPYNPDTKYKGPESIAISNRYIKYHNNGKYNGFVIAEKIESAMTYFDKWYGLERMDWLEQFRFIKNDELELWTTVDFAIEDLVKENKEITVSNIKNIISNNEDWKAKLKRSIFSDMNIESAIEKLETFSLN